MRAGLAISSPVRLVNASFPLAAFVVTKIQRTSLLPPTFGTMHSDALVKMPSRRRMASLMPTTGPYSQPSLDKDSSRFNIHIVLIRTLKSGESQQVSLRFTR
jgi:hypothetical protein